MSEHPNDWISCLLGERVQFQYGKSPNEVRSSKGTYPVYGSSGKTSEAVDFTTDSPSIIVGRKGTIDKPIFLEERCWAIDTTYFIDTFPHDHPKYLFYLLDSINLKSLNESTGVPSLSRDALHAIAVSLPPLPEQKKIAEILSGIDHSLAKLGDKLNALTRLRVQLTRQFLTHEDHPQSNLEGILPLDWQVKTLDEVAQFRRGSFPQPYGNPEWFDENGFPFVQVFDIDDNGKLKSSTKSRISKAGAEKSVFIPCGSLIVSLQGSIGRVAITQYDAYVDRTILIFTDYQKDLDREYFSLLIGDLFSRQGEVADGGVIKTITKQTLKDFSIKIPPLNEQKRMSKVVFALNRHISLYKKKLLKGNFLKQSLMGDLLSGRKRVSI